MIPVLLTEKNAADLSQAALNDLCFMRISGPDEWLSIAYQLLADHFSDNLLDAYDSYVEWLENGPEHPFPLLTAVSYCLNGKHAIITGVISGHIMEIADRAVFDPGTERRCFIYAIGHQVTSPVLIHKGIKGCGTRLLDAANRLAREHISKLGGRFCYSVLEAERRAIDFYAGRGYRWPQGLSYFQPPIRFNQDGSPVHPEIPEILLLRPEDPGMPADAIDRGCLESVISTMYRNWSLHGAKKTLSTGAFTRADEYLMGRIFGKIRTGIEGCRSLELVEMRIVSGKKKRHCRTFALGRGLEHRLEPLQPLDVQKINDFDEMLRAMSNMAFGARTLGEAFEVLYAMCSDPECKIVLTLSGALSIAKLDLMLSDMIERGLVYAIVSTGAIMSHGFNAERGAGHFKVPEGVSDVWLYEHGYDRIYDTIELECSLDEVEQIVGKILSTHPLDQPMCSSDFLRRMGRILVEQGGSRGIIQSAYRHGVPIFIPAFSDSEIGVDFAIYNYYRRRDNLPEVRFDPYIDYNRYSELIRNAGTRGIITLGGGVPRNWGQQVCTYIDAIERRQKGVPAADVRYKYGVRICPDPPYWGGLSGATYSEGVTWGKFMAPDEGGRFAEVHSDFTYVLPFLIKGLFQRLDKRGRRSEVG